MNPLVPDLNLPNPAELVGDSFEKGLASATTSAEQAVLGTTVALHNFKNDIPGHAKTAASWTGEAAVGLVDKEGYSGKARRTFGNDMAGLKMSPQGAFKGPLWGIPGYLAPAITMGMWVSSPADGTPEPQRFLPAAMITTGILGFEAMSNYTTPLDPGASMVIASITKSAAAGLVELPKIPMSLASSTIDKWGMYFISALALAWGGVFGAHQFKGLLNNTIFRDKEVVKKNKLEKQNRITKRGQKKLKESLTPNKNKTLKDMEKSIGKLDRGVAGVLGLGAIASFVPKEALGSQLSLADFQKTRDLLDNEENGVMDVRDQYLADYKATALRLNFAGSADFVSHLDAQTKSTEIARQAQSAAFSFKDSSEDKLLNFTMGTPDGSEELTLTELKKPLKDVTMQNVFARGRQGIALKGVPQGASKAKNYTLLFRDGVFGLREGRSGTIKPLISMDHHKKMESIAAEAPEEVVA